MRLLLLLRHARAVHASPGLADHERPLDERGRRDASAVGESLLREGSVPDRILSSTAVRAYATAQRAADGCGYRGEIRASRGLYLADCLELLGALQELGPCSARALIVAHNPGVEQLVQLLTRGSRPMPPAALARVRLPINGWEQLHPMTRGRLIE